MQNPALLQKSVVAGSWSDAAFIPETGTAEYFLLLESSEDTGFPQALESLQISEFRVRRELQRRLPPDLPRLFLEARVCRPGWLVEIEGLALLSRTSHFKPFL